MNRMEFVEALRQKLTDEGFNAEYVKKQCSTLTEKLSQLTDESAAQYTTESNLNTIVRKLMIQDGSHRKAKPTAIKKDDDSAPEQESADELDLEEEEEDELSPEETTPAVSKPKVSKSKAGKPKNNGSVATAPAQSAHPTPSTPSTATVRADVEFVDERSVSKRRSAAAAVSEYVPCSKPRLLTFLLALICSPTILLILGAAFGIFSGVFLALAASIFVIVIAIIGIVAVGSVLSIGALLYGATQLLTATKYVGFHEIGFGLIVAGATMAASILLYNAAVRLVPFLYLQMGKLLRWFVRKIAELAKNAVKGCAQL